MARFIFAFAADEDGAKVITQTKNSLGLSNLPSLAYRHHRGHRAHREGRQPRSAGSSSTAPSDRTVQDILSDQASGEERDEKARAEDFLRKALGDGPKPTKEIEEEAREAHGIAKRTLERARRDLRIPTAKAGAEWWISLPEHEGDLRANSAKSAKTAAPDGVGGVGGVDSPAVARSPSPPTPPRLTELALMLTAARSLSPTRGTSPPWTG